MANFAALAASARRVIETYGQTATLLWPVQGKVTSGGSATTLTTHCRLSTRKTYVTGAGLITQTIALLPVTTTPIVAGKTKLTTGGRTYLVESVMLEGIADQGVMQELVLT